MARTILHFPKKISVIESAAVTGELEAKGPLGSYFDLTSPDSKFGMDTWEKAEAEMAPLPRGKLSTPLCGSRDGQRMLGSRTEKEQFKIR